MDPGNQAGYVIGDGPADILEPALHDIVEHYLAHPEIARPPRREELDALWKFCTWVIRNDRDYQDIYVERGVEKLKEEGELPSDYSVDPYWEGISKEAGRMVAQAIRVAAKYKDKKKIKNKDGDEQVVYEYTDGQVQHRHREKAKKLEQLEKEYPKLRKQVEKDLNAKDDKKKQTAMAVALINETYERVGNEDSADKGHYGVTGWKASHISFKEGKAVLKYTGKSGVKHTKEVTDSKLISALKAAAKGKGDDEEVLPDVSASDINEYLKPYEITAKDMRGFHANREMRKALGKVRKKGPALPHARKEKDKILKEEFKKALEEVADIVGHTTSILRSDYLVPGLEDSYVHDGSVQKGKKVAIININNATDGPEGDGDEWVLRGDLGLQSSLTGYEQAIMQDMDIHQQPILKTPKGYFLRGHQVDDDAVDELIAAGYLEDCDQGVRQSALYEAKLKLYRSASGDRLYDLHVRRGETVAQIMQILQPEHWRLTCPICGNKNQCRCPQRVHEHAEVLEMPAVCGSCEEKVKQATKDHGEKEDEEAERLVRPEPKKKPPRNDLRREQVKPEDDPDVDHGDRGDDKDMSLNYKRIASRWLISEDIPSPGRVAFWHLMMAGDTPEWAVGKKFDHQTEGGEVTQVGWNSLSPEEQAKYKSDEADEQGESEKEPKEEEAGVSGAKKELAELEGPDEEKAALEEALGNLESAFAIEDAEKAKDALEEAKFRAERLLGKLEDKNSMDIILTTLEEGEKVVAEKQKQQKAEKKQQEKKEVAEKKWRETPEGTIESLGVDPDSKDLAKDSYKALTEASPKEREELSENIRGQLDELMNEDEPDKERLMKLDQMYNGVCLAQVVNDETPDLPDGQELSPQVVTLAKALKDTPGQDPSLLLGSMQDFCGPQGREGIKGAMGQMNNQQLYEFAGGEDSPYADIFDALNEVGEDGRPVVGEAQAAYARNMLERLLLNDMTYSHTAIKSAYEQLDEDEGAEDGEKGKKKKDKKTKNVEKKVSQTLDSCLRDTGAQVETFLEAIKSDASEDEIRELGKELELAQMESVASALAEFPQEGNRALQLIQEMLRDRDPERGDKFKTEPPLGGK